MFSDIPNMRVMFECDNPQTASQLVYSLKTLSMSTLAIGSVNGVHSQGAYVFTTVRGAATDVYRRALDYCKMHCGQIALVSVTPDSCAWDDCGVRILQDTIDHPLRRSLGEKLEHEFKQLVQSNSLPSRKELNEVLEGSYIQGEPTLTAERIADYYNPICAVQEPVAPRILVHILSRQKLFNSVT